MDLAEIKRVLKETHQIFDGPLDNEWTKGTGEAIESLFRANEVKAWSKWPRAQRIVGAKQMLCKLAGIDPGLIDGVVGHLTDHAIAVYDARKATGRDSVPEVEGIPASAENKPPLTSAPPKAVIWPKQTPNRSEIIAFFGGVGTNQTRLTLPYPLFFGKTKLETIGLHKKVHDPVERVLTNVLHHYGLKELHRLRLDQFSGALNVRKIRGGSNWSMHSWGIAFDFDAANNGMTNHCHDKATPKVKPAFCGPEYKFWIDAWEAEGAVSLGRSRDFDWMHFQFARL